MSSTLCVRALLIQADVAVLSYFEAGEADNTRTEQEVGRDMWESVESHALI